MLLNPCCFEKVKLKVFLYKIPYEYKKCTVNLPLLPDVFTCFLMLLVAQSQDM